MICHMLRMQGLAVPSGIHLMHLKLVITFSNSLLNFSLEDLELLLPDILVRNFFIWYLLEMVHFTGDIYEKLVPQHLLPFYLSKIFHFSRQKLVLR